MNQEILSMRRNTADLHSALFEGVVVRHGEEWAALPREVVSSSSGIESIIFEVIRPQRVSKPSIFKIGWKALRFETLTLTLTPGIVLYLIGLSKGWEAFWFEGIFALLGVLSLQISVNALNDVQDHLRLVDLPGARGGSGIIQKGWVSAREFKQFGYAALWVGALLGLPAVFENPVILLLIGGLGVLGLLAYSGHPLGLKYRTWGDFLIFGLTGPLLAIGLTEACFGKLDGSTLSLGLFFGFLAWGISHLNNLHDIEVDLSRGVKTLASRIGFRASRHLFVAIYLFAFLTVVFGVWAHQIPPVAAMCLMIGVPWVVRLVARVYQASGPMSVLLGPIRLQATYLHFYLGMLLSVGTLISYILK